jgi:hypothetical protein
MAETTPGPLIMVLQFVGFMAAYREPGSLAPILAGTLGGLLATWVTFTPCFLWIFLGAPFVEKLRGNKGLNAVRLARERVDGVPPRSTFDFPVSHHPKIHSADQIGSVCLGGFHVGHSLLQSTRVWPKNDRPSDNSRNRSNHDRRIEPDRPDDCCQDQDSSGSNGDFWNENDLPTPLYNVGELLNVGFDVQDLFVQVTVVIHLKSTLPRQIHDRRRQLFIVLRQANRVGRHARPSTGLRPFETE